MAHLARSVAALRITGDDLVPQEISALLGADPTQAHQKGQDISTKSFVRVAKIGVWRLQAKDSEPENLDGQVAELLSKLTQDLQIWQWLGERFQLELFCGCFMSGINAGARISPATLRGLGERGIELSLDIYAPNRDAQVSNPQDRL